MSITRAKEDELSTSTQHIVRKGENEKKSVNVDVGRPSTVESKSKSVTGCPFIVF